MAACPPLCPTHAPLATRHPMTRILPALLALALVVTPSAPAQEPDAKNHWAFKTPTRPAVPKLGTANPIDAFIRQRLDREGLKPSPEADRVTLVRRLYLDLI